MIRQILVWLFSDSSSFALRPVKYLIVAFTTAVLMFATYEVLIFLGLVTALGETLNERKFAVVVRRAVLDI